MASPLIKTKSEPLIRIVKKDKLSPGKAIMLRVASVFLALIAGGIFILAIGYNPFEIYGTILSGSLRSKLAIQSTVKIAIPLLLTSLGVTLAFKMKFWNIGAEGQMILGGIFASYFALFHSDWPHWALLVVSFLAGAVGGGLWALIPALFKSKFDTNETLLTLMLNYIALYIIDYLRQGPWKDPNAQGFPRISPFESNATIKNVFGLQGGWVVAIIILFLVFILLKYTKKGYEIHVVGESPATAKYAGMNVRRIVLTTMFLSGAISGVAGMIQATGTDKTLSMGIAGGVGFTAIIVAWLSQLNPFVIFFVTVMFSILEKGSGVIQSTFGISGFTSDVLQGVILFFILAFEFFVRYSLVIRKRGEK